jgi:hypothetical protein
MFTLRVIEHLDVVEYILPRVVSGFVSSSPDTFALEQVEAAFSDGVIMAISPTPHAVFKIVLLQE